MIGLFNKWCPEWCNSWSQPATRWGNEPLAEDRGTFDASRCESNARASSIAWAILPSLARSQQGRKGLVVGTGTYYRLAVDEILFHVFYEVFIYITFYACWYTTLAETPKPEGQVEVGLEQFDCTTHPMSSHGSCRHGDHTKSSSLRGSQERTLDRSSSTSTVAERFL